MRGFVPADEVLLFRQKDPKPFLPVRGPSVVPPPPHRIKMAQKLATLKQSSPKSRIRCCGSAAPNAGEKSKILKFSVIVLKALI